MFKEYDVVINKEDLPNVPKGSQGTIVLCYENAVDYEVEFVDDNYNTLNVITVSENYLQPVLPKT
jgi:hypothetical protein